MPAIASRFSLLDDNVSLADLISGTFLRSLPSLGRQDKTASGDAAQSSGAITDYVILSHVKPMFTPNDPLLGNQWHLTGAYGIRAQTAWDDYTGAGITIGMIDDGVQFTHPDLDAYYNAAIDYDSYTKAADGSPKNSADKHGTATAGVAAGNGNNGLGVSGVAYEAGLTSYRINFSSSISDSMMADLFNRQTQVDVSSNSWGFTGFFSDNFKTGWNATKSALLNDVSNGRDGLGTNIVFAAGNSRTSGDNTNYHSMQNSQYTITVAATDQNGKYTYFSTPGASILVAAPGSGIVSTDRTGSAGYVSGDYVSGLAGTSFSTPIVSGVVALMLDANPNLGWRDVQEILAYSARNSDPGHAGWQYNGAENWNGGGLHFSHDYGFGLVDARAAVRLAESWQGVHTIDNRAMVNSGTLTTNASIPDNNATGISRSFTFSDANVLVDRVELDVNITHGWIGDLKVFLTSPDGTVSTLVNRPGINPDSPSGYGSSNDNINFTLTSNAFWGEQADGVWTVRVADVDSGYAGTLGNWALRLYGDADTSADIYFYSDEFSSAANAARTTLTDTGGADTINAAMVTSNTQLSLLGGTYSTIDGVTLAIAAGTTIENALLGDGNDTVIGNAVANVINGGRGDDLIEGGGGNDSIIAGLGFDTARYLGAFVDYLVTLIDAATVTIKDLVTANGDEGTDTVTGVERFLFGGVDYSFADITGGAPPPNAAPDAKNDSATTGQETPVIINVLANDTDANGDALTVTGVTTPASHGSVALNADQTFTYTPEAGWYGTDTFMYGVDDGHGGADAALVTLTVTKAASLTLSGNSSANTLVGGAGNDTISGNGGNDTLYGNGGNDIIRGGSGNDIMYGGTGNDTMYANSGSDTFTGGQGADTMYGYNYGKDTFIYQSMDDAGDIIKSFKRNQHVLDFRPLFDTLGYTGTNPVADGWMSMQYASGDLKVYIDADGAGAAHSSTLMLMLDNANITTLTAGTDYLVQ